MNKASPSPVIVMPIHDLEGRLLPHMAGVGNKLSSVFARAFVSVSHETAHSQPGYLDFIRDEPFYELVDLPQQVGVGVELRTLFLGAARRCQPQQICHLAFMDRVAFAVQSQHAAQFLADVAGLRPERTPVTFHRSEHAWQTHPATYRELEQMISRTGELLFGRWLEFAWCHLALTADTVLGTVPLARNSDLSMVVEIVLHLRDQLHCIEVDWLAWEDPFLFERDAAGLKVEREASSEDVLKRLAYVIPALRILERAASD